MNSELASVLFLLIPLVIAFMVIKKFVDAWTGKSATKSVDRKYKRRDRVDSKCRKRLESLGFTYTGSEHERIPPVTYQKYVRTEKNGDTLEVRHTSADHGKMQQGKVTLIVTRYRRNLEIFRDGSSWRPFGLFGFSGGYIDQAISRATRRKFTKEQPAVSDSRYSGRG
ncbi:hypothetical protein [Arthrobacter sp. zg-Y1110]|uniref:hypothetical protein n=1 Tax=Arthrobacter sp. zg-Y1110 TaxID=2886932 RepID=UPI001D13ABF9|nr:hypothetical protein [Arthrobacter sp. zg-Y1110]MCC3292956.1 hypothetical protein [Arthrobacter sp. zg-Y1110]UWX86895.1 hypothetical protein N2K99_18805 [Arthrobacter sp. zg-Y1110]